MSAGRTPHKGDRDRLFVRPILQDSPFARMPTKTQQRLRGLSLEDRAELVDRMRRDAAAGDAETKLGCQVIIESLSALQTAELIARAKGVRRG